MLILAAGAAITQRGDWTDAGFVLLVLPFVACPVGFVIAVVPNFVGSLGLHALGVQNDASRLPVFWGMIGGLVAGGGVGATGAPFELAAAFAATGSACALICRSGADWPD